MYKDNIEIKGDGFKNGKFYGTGKGRIKQDEIEYVGEVFGGKR
jgi:hypothetical protein